MFVFSFKASTLKYIGVMAFCAMAIVMTVVLVPSADIADGSAVEVSASHKSADFKNIKTNSDRIAFLESYGWQVQGEAVASSSVMIPEEFDELYEDYNKLQKKEGLDLKKYRGKTVDLFTYPVTNSENIKAYATLLIYKNRVIGGDVSTGDPGGDMLSFGGE